MSLDPIYAYFDADEGSLLEYDRLARLGQRRSSRDFKNPVHVALANEEGFPHDGVMDFVDNQLDRGTGTIIGRALLPNPDLSLIPGLFARLRLPGSGEYRAILVPDEAIGSDQSQKFVFVVDGESKAEYDECQSRINLDLQRTGDGHQKPEDEPRAGKHLEPSAAGHSKSTASICSRVLGGRSGAAVT